MGTNDTRFTWRTLLPHPRTMGIFRQFARYQWRANLLYNRSRRKHRIQIGWLSGHKQDKRGIRKSIINKVKELNDAVYSQLSKCDFIYKDGVLDLYPKKKIVKAILSRENNINVLNQANPGAKIIVHDLGDHPSDTKSDAVIDKISDIMGGKVQNDTGGNPFE